MSMYGNEPDEVLLQLIWDYLSFQRPLRPADVIIAGGSRDVHVAREAARLYLEGWAPLIVVSGGFHSVMGVHEVNAYINELFAAHVPETAVWPEPNSRNLGDNVVLSRRLLEAERIFARTVILVHMPIISRRFYATAMKQWQEPQPCFISRHEQVDFVTYCGRPGMEDIIPRMLGHFERMHSHVVSSLQIPQAIPVEVQLAYNTLIERGYRIHELHD